MIARKMATTTLSNLTKVIKDNGDGTYTMDNLTPSKNTSWTFKLGEPFDAAGFDGKVHKVQSGGPVRLHLCRRQSVSTART
jgi:hypothetical protein